MGAIGPPLVGGTVSCGAGLGGVGLASSARPPGRLPRSDGDAATPAGAPACVAAALPRPRPGLPLGPGETAGAAPAADAGLAPTAGDGPPGARAAAALPRPRPGLLGGPGETGAPPAPGAVGPAPTAGSGLPAPRAAAPVGGGTFFGFSVLIFCLSSASF